MLIVMKSDATEAQVDAVLRVIEELGYKAHPMPGATRTATFERSACPEAADRARRCLNGSLTRLSCKRCDNERG